MLNVAATLLPYLSSTEKWVVFVPVLFVTAIVPNSLLGVIRGWYQLLMPILRHNFYLTIY